jgi:hypothetical protein
MRLDGAPVHSVQRELAGVAAYLWYIQLVLKGPLGCDSSAESILACRFSLLPHVASKDFVPPSDGSRKKSDTKSADITCRTNRMGT